jgi:hypothetical protein
MNGQSNYNGLTHAVVMTLIFLLMLGVVIYLAESNPGQPINIISAVASWNC